MYPSAARRRKAPWGRPVALKLTLESASARLYDILVTSELVEADVGARNLVVAAAFVLFNAEYYSEMENEK